MKKVWTLLLSLALALSLCACQIGKEAEEPTEPVIFTFPASTTVLGVDVSGLTKEDAWMKFASAADAYILNLDVDGVPITLTAQDLDLRCDQDAFMAAASALEAGAAPDLSNLIGFNEGKLRAIMSQNFNKDAVEASLVFDDTTGQYTLLPDADGQKSNPNALVAEAKTAICNLTGQHSMTGVSEIIQPVRSADDPELQDAMAKANKMVGIQLTLKFSPGGETKEHTVPTEIIRSFVTIGEDGLTPIINKEAVEAYVTELSEEYSIAGKTGSFKTTGGKTVSQKVSYNGHYVDNDDLTDDLIKCLKEGISGTRTVNYQASGIRSMPYGGTYIEVDLTAQHLWFYKKGKCIVSTDFVSGKVAENMCTPNGVFSIYSKEPNRYLTGEDYRSFVNYWMPFYRGYGLHDATWRSSFGGDIYLYNGSHGCVNLPLSAAGKIYKNASVGTKVILYGGAKEVAPSPQKLTGTKSYNVADDKGTFKLNIKPKYKGGEITYSSNNTKVATVDSSGKVTIKGIGTAKIKVSVAKFSYYTAAETTVTIKVHSACDDGRHVWGDPTTVKEPTCQPGTEKVTCTKCGKSKNRELDPVKDHAFGNWEITKAATCGADGKQVKTCASCGEQKSEAIKATGEHTFGEWKTSKKPTCVDSGTEKRSCSVCGKEESQKIAPTGEHTFDTWVTETEATCEKDGLKRKVCGVCGEDSGQTEVISAKGHKFDWVTTKKATCTDAGSQQEQCQRSGCKATGDTKEIAAKGHDYKWVTTKKPSCTDAGSEQEQCQRSGCNATGSTKEIAAKGHSYENGSCKTCGAADPNAASGE